MRKHRVKRPDEAALRRLLAEEQASPEGAVLRLAWQAGLTRDEIAALRWEQVSFQEERLELSDRTVPLGVEVRTWLWRFYEVRGQESGYVVASGRSGDRMQPESISRLARRALDRGGLAGVQLMDLRHDWILRCLNEQDWPAVARISGVAVPALQARFSDLVTPQKTEAEARSATLDEFRLWKILQVEKRTPAGLALWLAWQMGLQAGGDAALLARAAEAGSLSRGDAMELLGLSRTAAYGRLRRLTEQGRLVRVGGRYYLSGTVVPPQDQPAVIRAYLEREGFAYRQDIAALLRVRPQQCGVILRHLVERGTLVQQGQKYLLPPEQTLQAECI